MRPELAEHGLDPLDIATGMAFGLVADAPPLPPPSPSLAAGIEAVLVRMLSRPPCLVAFSGGHDSSAALTLSVRAAERHGLDPPVPITYRFPGHPEASEKDYQQAVVGHLGLDDWIRIDIDDELDCVGDWARDAVAKIGLRWPFNTFFLLPLARRARGGSLVTGFGGDELLAPGTHDRAVAVLSAAERPRRSDLRAVARAFAPRALRRRAAAGQASPPAWLTAAGEAEYRRRSGELRGRARLTYGREIRVDTWPSRYVQQGLASIAAVGDAADAATCGLFAEPEVVSALAASHERRGPRSRGALFAALCGDAAPPSFFDRTTKARFNSPFWGPHARAFAAAAEPERLDVDRELVDPAALVEAWRQPDPDARSFLLAQACAFAREGLTPSR